MHRDNLRAAHRGIPNARRCVAPYRAQLARDGGRRDGSAWRASRPRFSRRMLRSRRGCRRLVAGRGRSERGRRRSEPSRLLWKPWRIQSEPDRLRFRPAIHRLFERHRRRAGPIGGSWSFRRRSWSFRRGSWSFRRRRRNQGRRRGRFRRRSGASCHPHRASERGSWSFGPHWWSFGRHRRSPCHHPPSYATDGSSFGPGG